jgi:hypothetical protein
MRPGRNKSSGERDICKKNKADHLRESGTQSLKDCLTWCKWFKGESGDKV